MPVSTTNTKKQQTVYEPLEHQMWTREGFDRKGLRREIAGVTNIELGDKYVEQEDRSFVDPRTVEMPVGPTGMGEAGGTGTQMLRVDGERWPTHRWAQGFEVLEEDSQDVAEQRNATLELFDFFADASFYTGLGPSGQYAEGFFSWLRNNIPSNRVFDCEDYDGDSGDEEYLSNGVQENLIKYDAYSEVSGRILDQNSSNWDVMVGSQKALAKFNKVTEGDYNKDTYFERLNADNSFGGVNDMMLVPDSIQPTRLPRDSGLSVEELVVDLVGGGSEPLGDNEVFLIPDLQEVRESMFRTYEMGAPESFGPLDMRMGKKAYDYAWRYTHKFDPESKYPDATDVVHIKNVDVLFQ